MKKLFLITVLFCFALSVNVFAASITIESAVLKDNTVTVSGKVTGGTDGQQITFLAADITGDVYNYEKLVYLNQKDADTDKDGSFTHSFDVSYLSDDKVYIVRLGGTNIDIPSEMVILKSEESDKLILGDADLDGRITANDAAVTLQEVVFHLDSVTDEQRTAMNVTGSDNITSNDAALIFYKSYNNEYKFPAEK